MKGLLTLRGQKLHLATKDCTHVERYMSNGDQTKVVLEI